MDMDDVEKSVSKRGRASAIPQYIVQAAEAEMRRKAPSVVQVPTEITMSVKKLEDDSRMPAVLLRDNHWPFSHSEPTPRNISIQLKSNVYEGV
jgi:hypothetical protein